jgi:hypothetical protein
MKAVLSYCEQSIVRALTAIEAATRRRIFEILMRLLIAGREHKSRRQHSGPI